VSSTYLGSMKKLKFLFFPTILALAFGLMLSCAKSSSEDSTSSDDTTAPTVYSTYPSNSASSVAPNISLTVTFSEAMDATTITTNSSGTNCLGTLQLSSDSFSTCLQMFTSPTASGNTNAGNIDFFVVKYNSSGTKQWTKQLGTSSNDYASGVATDSSGNVYVTGYTYGGLDGNTNAGNRDLFVVKYNSSGTKQWTKQLGTSSDDWAYGVATDSSGNVYVTGGTKGGLVGNASAGNTDLFILKYNSIGRKQLTQPLGSSGLDYANAIAIDSSGNLYVAGITYGGLDWNTNSGANDLFVVKYNSSGTKQWTEQLGTPSSDAANAVATDSSGNVYVAGVTYGVLGEKNKGNSDLFVVKYNSSGTKQWTKQNGTDMWDEARGVATDSSGNVYVVGGTKGSLNGSSNSGRTDAFVIKFNSSGTKQWTKKLGTWQNDLANGVATDSSGNFYVAGDTSQELHGNSSAGKAELFLDQYNSSGTKQWTKQLGTSNNDLANGVATDPSGNVYVTGGTYGGLDGNTNAGNSDLFVVKYNTSGTKQWTKQLGSSSRDYDYGVATDSSRNVYVSVDTYGGLDGNTSAGSADLFVVKYNSSGTKQ